MYYFCLKTVDDAGNVSAVSNCAPAKSSSLGDVILRPSADCYIDEGNATSSYATATSNRMTLCGYDVGSRQRGLLTFDLSSVASMNVTSATLSLYAWNGSQCKGSTGFYGVYPFSHSWVDSGASWNNSASGTPWTAAGGDFDPTPDAMAAKQGSAPNWYSWEVTARVKSWLSGASTNYGWIVKCTDEVLHNQDQFYQKEVNNSNAPKLVISDLPAPVPGDVNNDGVVDLLDLLAMANSWAANGGVDRAYDPWCDLNNDGTVNVIDLLILADSWGQ